MPGIPSSTGGLNQTANADQAGFPYQVFLTDPEPVLHEKKVPSSTPGTAEAQHYRIPALMHERRQIESMDYAYRWTCILLRKKKQLQRTVDELCVAWVRCDDLMD
ncbi:hypothetical protein CEXT_620351 [Caerostris extrusa]|uniref:Uncharacterized protein n=1 Tax=Caerostris extrusa TaxID=172846 RepID=A0AAV4XD23_CAEEX|nr:hypothetical protein CEXT_620351 [Caerostris extrusa]